jgi:hypothetical protein
MNWLKLFETLAAAMLLFTAVISLNIFIMAIQNGNVQGTIVTGLAVGVCTTISVVLIREVYQEDTSE